MKEESRPGTRRLSNNDSSTEYSDRPTTRAELRWIASREEHPGELENLVRSFNQIDAAVRRRRYLELHPTTFEPHGERRAA